MRHKIICGHVLDVLKTLPDESVDTIVTSPPYWGLRDYGEETNTIWSGDSNCKHEWDNEIVIKQRGDFSKANVGNNRKGVNPQYLRRGQFCKKCGAWYGQLGLEPTLDLYIEHLMDVMRELKRVLKKTGTIWWNHGDNYGTSGSYSTRASMGAPTTDEGLFGGGRRVRNRDIVPVDKAIPPKCMALQNYRFILRCVDELGLILRNVIIWHKPNHMPSSVKDRFTNAYEPVFMLTKSKDYYFDLEAVRVPHKEPQRSGKKESNNPHTYQHGIDTWCVPRYRIYNPFGKNPGDVWTISTQPFPEAHFATFPEKLVEPMIKAGCPQWICKKCGNPRERIVKIRVNEDKVPDRWKKTYRGKVELPNSPTQRRVSELYKEALSKERYTIGWTDCGCGAGWEAGVVLDPFAGSGTVGIVAERLGRNSILIDLNKEYCEMGLRRLKPLAAQKKLTGEESIIETEGF